MRCEERGETCIFSLEEHDENSEERKERERRLCTKCGTLFPNNQQKEYHEKFAKGNAMNASSRSSYAGLPLSLTVV
jgi:hypothetical protein